MGGGGGGGGGGHLPAPLPARRLAPPCTSHLHHGLGQEKGEVEEEKGRKRGRTTIGREEVKVEKRGEKRMKTMKCLTS